MAVNKDERWSLARAFVRDAEPADLDHVHGVPRTGFDLTFARRPPYARRRRTAGTTRTAAARTARTAHKPTSRAAGDLIHRSQSWSRSSSSFWVPLP